MATPLVTQNVAALQGAVLMSIVTRVELEGGVYREPAHAPIRRARLDAMLSAIPALAFDDLAAKTYGDHCRKRRLLAAEAARPHDRSSRSGTPGDLGHLQPVMTSQMFLVSRCWSGRRSSQEVAAKVFGREVAPPAQVRTPSL